MSNGRAILLLNVTGMGDQAVEAAAAVGLPDVVVLNVSGFGVDAIGASPVVRFDLANEQATAQSSDAEWFLHTGDLAIADADGCVYIVDRLNELINYTGPRLGGAPHNQVPSRSPHPLAP